MNKIIEVPDKLFRGNPGPGAKEYDFRGKSFQFQVRYVNRTRKVSDIPYTWRYRYIRYRDDQKKIGYALAVILIQI